MAAVPARESVKVLRERPQAGLAYGGITSIDQDGRPKVRSWATEARRRPHRAAIYMRKVDLPCPTLTFRRKCIDEVGFFDETMRATEDRDLCLRIALRYEVAFVPRVIACYRVSASSMTTDPERMFQAQMQFIEKHYGAPGCGWAARRIALSQCYRQRADALSLRRQGGPPWPVPCAPWPSLHSISPTSAPPHPCFCAALDLRGITGIEIA